MTNNGAATHGTRVLVLTPTSKDAELTQAMLHRAGISSQCYESLEELCGDLGDAASAILLSEESVSRARHASLTDWLTRQPAWSDLPILMLAQPGADSADVAKAMDLLGNVTVLERPTRVAALVSAVRTAIRARKRQYQIRDQLAENEQTAQQLRRSVDEMRTLLDTLPIGVLIAHDPGGQRITGNRIAAEILRVSTDDNLSPYTPGKNGQRHLRICRDGTQIAAHDYPTQRATRGEPVRGEELECVFDDGTIVHLVVSAMALFGTNGAPRGAVAAMVDITAQKSAEAALREADRRKDDFLAMLAHELRNPLAPIRNALQILRLTSNHNAPADHLADMLERQVGHMVRLVDDLLEVSRITHGKIELRRETIGIESVVRSAIDTSRPLIDAGEHELTVDIADEPMALYADPVRMAQVIANLLNNAAKYTEQGGRIWLGVRRDQDSVVISVRDSGVGIPPEMLPRVFDMFTQVNHTSGRAQGGLGIGLTLVKTLVEMHGGTVTAHSGGRERGSEFVVRLPFAHPRRVSGENTPGAERLMAITRRRVLVVDDNRDAADSLGAVLTLLGADVRVVHSGPAALEAAAQYRPAVMLVDIGMQGMDGHEVARQIRSSPDATGVVLIALTGWGQAEDRFRSKEAGFDYHLVKPADLDALQTLLATLDQRPAASSPADTGAVLA